MKEQKQVFKSPKIHENHATIMKKIPKIMNYAKTSKNTKNHEIMLSGTPANSIKQSICCRQSKLMSFSSVS